MKNHIPLAKITPEDFRALKQLEKLARDYSDGHLTILRFTTNWRVSLNTVAWEDDITKYKEQIKAMAEGRTLAAAIEAALDRLIRND